MVPRHRIAIVLGLYVAVLGAGLALQLLAGPGVAGQSVPLLLVLAAIVAQLAGERTAAAPGDERDRRAWLSSAVAGLAVSAVILPLFFGGFFLFGPLVPGVSVALRWPENLAQAVPFHVLMAALPEELFFRGALQEAFNARWPRRWRLLGAPCGVGLLLASVLFALAHLVLRQNPITLTVFFPSLIFGWLYDRNRSVAGPILCHALCNIALLFFPSNIL